MADGYNEKTVSVSITGDTTRTRYAGDVTFKCVLSKREELLADQIRRRAIGPSPENTPAPVKLQGDSYMYGQLTVRIKKAPKWWETSDGGMDELDGNLVEELYLKALEVEKEFKDKLREDADQASKDLSAPKKD